MHVWFSFAAILKTLGLIFSQTDFIYFLYLIWLPQKKKHVVNVGGEKCMKSIAKKKKLGEEMFYAD